MLVLARRVAASGRVVASGVVIPLLVSGVIRLLVSGVIRLGYLF